VLFGSDAAGRSFASQLGKVTAAELTDVHRMLILAGNATRLFALESRAGDS